MDTYRPEEGDKVVFPNAHAKWNRDTVYRVYNVSAGGINVVTEDKYSYSISWAEADEMGMRLA